VGDLDGDGLAEAAVGTLFEITAGHPFNTSGVFRILFLSPTLGLRKHLLVGPGHPNVAQLVEGFAAGLAGRALVLARPLREATKQGSGLTGESRRGHHGAAASE